MRNISNKFKNKKVLFDAGMLLTFMFVLTVLVRVLININGTNVVAVAGNGDRKLPIYSVDTNEPKVSISFDAAWGNEDTSEILRILEENNVKATFFLCGYWVEKYPDTVKEIYNAGHEIGNHGNTHAHGAQLSLDENKNEIMGVHTKVKDLLGIDINLFRPPYGEYNNTVIQAAEDLTYYTIQWDVDTYETKKLYIMPVRI